MGLAIKHTTHNNKKTPAGKSRKQVVTKTKLPDLSSDPYFKKKADSASRLLEKYGTPKK
jgi:hypothetical protein